MSRPIDELRIECGDCGRRGNVNAAELARWLGDQPTFSNIAELWGRFRCSSCRSKHIRISSNEGRLLIDPENMRTCALCERPILLPRLQVIPDASTCQLCAEEQEIPERPPAYPMPPRELTKCPKCGRPTVVRENSQTLHYFIGCTRFPDCNWTAKLPEERF